MLSQSLQISASQQLQLTPKLQQAIHLLQLSTQELTQELQQMILSNIFLESDNTIDIPESQLDGSDIGDSFDPTSLLESNCASEDRLVECDKESLYEAFLPQYTSNDKGNANVLEYYAEPANTLKAHLQWQLYMSSLSEKEKKIGEIIIDSISQDGFLEESCEEIKKTLKKQNEHVSTLQIEKVISFIHSFDPIGAGARNLQESLTIQLNRLASTTPYIDLAKQLINNHLDLLAAHQYKRIRKIYKITDDTLEKTIQLIKTLNPRPGRMFSNLEENYVIPDVIIEKKGKNWQVSLNHLTKPKLHFNNSYAQLMTSKSDQTSKQFVHQHVQEAKWLIKCLHTRNDTLLKVAKSIVEHQKPFLEYGAAAMKPLILQDIAEDLGVHQSTISRITTHKYIQTPRGTFELKYFFTAHLNTSYGEQCSALATQNYIQEIIKQEKNGKPCSDSLIAEKLKNFGINIARRTVAKYREAMTIPPAYLRKTI